MRKLCAALAGMMIAAPVFAGAAEVTMYSVEAEFDDVTWGVESAITDRGLVIDYVSHVGEMLNRTAADVGASKDLYSAANVYLFCSATLSRKVMEADADNIAYCPYGVFVRQMAGAEGMVEVGYRHLPDGPMQEVQALLDDIAREAVGLE